MKTDEQLQTYLHTELVPAYNALGLNNAVGVVAEVLGDFRRLLNRDAKPQEIEWFARLKNTRPNITNEQIDALVLECLR